MVMSLYPIFKSLDNPFLCCSFTISFDYYQWVYDLPLLSLQELFLNFRFQIGFGVVLPHIAGIDIFLTFQIIMYHFIIEHPLYHVPLIGNDIQIQTKLNQVNPYLYPLKKFLATPLHTI